MLEHGGRLRQAAAQYAIPVQEWLDLSTGINPQGWPVPAIPPSIWLRLPEDNDGLEQAAREYYGTENLLPVAGSQAAIQTLPKLRAPCTVGVIHPGYAEHAHAWRRAGHRVIQVEVCAVDQYISQLEVLLLINPNNPTGICFSQENLFKWWKNLAARGGWLLVDEAFIDATPGQSLVPHAPKPGLILLRSLGKFFGLAGARVGFVIADPLLLDRLQCELGPWTVAAPSRWIAARALKDKKWQLLARQQLAIARARLAQCLVRHGLQPAGGCALFQWVCTPDAPQIHRALAQRGILTRLFKDPSSLRFGLPGNAGAWRRLDSALRMEISV